jgi:signal transduction histidine kinase
VRFQPTIRLRLTLVYGGMFLLAGAVLLTLNFVLVSRGLDRRAGAVGVQVGSSFVAPAADGPHFLQPVTASGPGPGQRVVVSDGRPLQEVLGQFEVKLRNDALHQLVIQSALALGLMALASIGLGWGLAGRVLRPIQDMTLTARRLSDTNLHERLAMAGPDDELKELADTFDGMLGRLESAFESQRRFVANASHELRTPLAIQRTLVDVALADPDATPEELRTMAAAVGDAVDRSERLIDGLLVLARSQQGVGPTSTVDLAEVAAAAVDQAGGEIAGAGLTVRCDLEPAPVAGNRVLLERLAANLVENAVRHNVAGGWVEVVTTASGNRAQLAVRNGGAPIPPEQVAGLFEPFRRGTADRVGSSRGHGLGLSIVEAVATAHHGSVRAEAPAAGGLAVTVDLPAAVSR